MNQKTADLGQTEAQNLKRGSDDRALPDPGELPSLRLYSHSSLFYWWPVWVFGFVAAAITYFQGGTFELDQVRREWFHPGSALGLSYIAVLLLVILFTNVKFRGIYSVVLVLAIAFVAVTLAWLGWWDDIAELIPQVSVHMNMGFYLVSSTLLFVIWALAFFIFDRLTYWNVRPGLMTEEHMIGSAAESYDTVGMLVEKRAEDFFRHNVLGLGAGDLALTVQGGKQAELQIPNVLFVGRKVARLQKLVAIKPDDFDV